MNSLTRLFETVRRLRPSQVGHRVVRRLDGWLRRGPQTAPWAAWTPIPCLPRDARRPAAFPFDRPDGEGFLFAGRRAVAGAGGIEWAGEPSLLQRYHAGYAEAVRAFAQSGDLPRARAWLHATSAGAPDHPYVRSRRILALVEVRAAGLLEADATIVADAAEVARRPEWDVRGNHLVANGAALLRAGTAYRGPAARRWKGLGQSILSTCAREQVLADGVHYERSPVYQSLVLEHMLVALESCAARGEAPPAGVEEAAARLAGALSDLVLPDGALARWRDGAPGVALPVDTLVAWASRRAGPVPDRRRGSRAFPSGGFAIIESEDGRSAVTLAAAPACPDELPAHGHADALAYEFVMGGARVVVGAGTADYAAGAERDRDRLPGAFAGLLLDGKAWADPFASFRVGARGWARRLETGETRGWRWAYAAAGGFPGLPGVTVHRNVALVSDDALVVIDEFAGDGTHRVEQFVPLAPGFAADVAPDGSSAVLRRDDATLRLTAPGARIAVETGSMAVGLGVAVPRVVLRLTSERAFPVRGLHALLPGAAPATVTLQPIYGNEVRVTIRRGDTTTVGYLPVGRPA